MIPNSKPAEHNKCKVKYTAFPHLQSLVSYSIEPNRDLYKALPKAQRARGLSSSCQSHIASSNTNLDQISSSES